MQYGGAWYSHGNIVIVLPWNLQNRANYLINKILQN